MKQRILYLKKMVAITLLTLFYMLPSAEAQVQSKPADKFVDMIGVNVHSARNENNYTNSSISPNAEQTTINAVTNMRIRHLRDAIYGWNGGVEDFDMNNRGVVTRFSSISQAGTNAGIPGGITWIITDNQDNWQRLRDNYLIPLGNKVIVLEGANENMGVTDAQAYQQLTNWWNNIKTSLPNLKIATNTGPTNPCEIATQASINNSVDYGNAHPYHFWPPYLPFNKTVHCGFNSSCAPPTNGLWTAPDNNGGTIGFVAATRANRVAANKPMIFTEWGYPTISNDDQGWGVDQPTAAKYMLRGFLEHFNAGIVYSCSYELLDWNDDGTSTDAEDNFGLATTNGTLKPSGMAVKRMIALLEDIGNTNISTGTLNYTLSGGGLSFVDDQNANTNEIHQTLVQKANGKFYLVLWQEAISTNANGVAVSVPSVNVTVNFGQNAAILKAYLPATTDNGSPVVNTTNVSSYTFSVPDHPLVIEITPGTVSGTAPTVTTTAITGIGTTTATSGGNVTNGGSASVTARGVCWSTAANPTTALTTKTVNGSGTGTFTSSITSLTANTLYHVRAYATNSVGTSYGSDLTFTTTASGGTASLSGSVVASTASITLSSIGTTDWKHFRNNVRKSGATQISNWAAIGGTAANYTDDLRAMSWTGGSPTATGTNVTTGKYNTGVNNGFSFTVPAGNGTNTLYVYVGGWNTGGKLTAHLSNSAAPDYVNTRTLNTSDYDLVYTITYNAAQAGQTLTVSWVINTDGGGGTLNLQAAALVGTASRPANPSPAVVENSLDNSIVIFPNPAVNYATINFKTKLKGEGANIEVTDLSGKKVFSSGKLGYVSSFKLNTGNYAKGTYFISIIQGKVKTNRKLIIQ